MIVSSMIMKMMASQKAVASIATTTTASSTSIQLSRIVLLVRQGTIQSNVNFYHQALQLPIIRYTEEWAELATTTTTTNTSTSNMNNNNNNNNGVILSIQTVPMGQESQLCIGYSPWMTFTISNLDATITSCIQQGAHLDGPIQYPAHGKIALLRTPHSFHMIGLYEPTTK